jgi:hypothetical protein
MPSFKQAKKDGNLEAFISEHEPLEAPKEAVKRYIDASAIPLGSSKEDRSDDFLDGSGGCT